MGQNISVLIVEQDQGHAQIIKEVLEEVSAKTKNTCTLCMALSSNEALDWLEYNTRTYKRPDLIIMNLEYETEKNKIGGKDIIRHVKTHILLKHIPIIVLCKDGSPENVNMVYQERANCYILKPAEDSSMRELIAEIWTYWSESATLYLPK